MLAGRLMLNCWSAGWVQAYGKALELDAPRLYSLVQSGSICICLGEYAEALKNFER